MAAVAIRVDGLGKRFRLGERERYLALRDVLARAVTAPFRRREGGNGNGAGRAHIWALRDVSFTVGEGETIGIVGRNGAGKSTLLKLLAGITLPTEGSAEIRGRVGSLLEVGTGFHPELTGRENIYFSGSILGMKRREIDRKFDEIVAFSGVETFLDTPLKHYSSGMQLRLAFSVAAHLEPEVLLVDEVLAVGDAAFQKKCLGKMNDVARSGRTVLFVSHQTSAILQLCPRSLWLERGGVRSTGPSREVVAQYLASLQTGTPGTLDAATNRHGRGHVRFTRAWMENSEGMPVEHVMSGERVRIVASYESAGGEPLANSRFSIAVEDMLGQPLFLCDTSLGADDSRPRPASGRVVCTLPELPLNQGRYLLTLFLEAYGEVQDWVTSAVGFDVSEGDFFGSGRQAPSGWTNQCVLVRHKWGFE